VAQSEADSLVRNPIRGTAGCCASATAPVTTSTKANTQSPSHFGFSILRQDSEPVLSMSKGQVLDLRLSEQDFKNRLNNVLRMLSVSESKIGNRNLKCHLMTLSARASTCGGIVTPICFAVLRLITSSNLVGCSTGNSPGLAPLRILST
jgi:hypothetical protein